MILAFKEGFDVSGEVVELAFVTGFFDLAMGSLFELIQFHRCRSVFTRRVIHGFHRDRAEGYDFSIDHDADVIPLECAA